jgi:hypothetical protein
MEKGKNRIAGIFYLCMILFGIFPQIVRSNILVFGDNVDVLANINNSAFIFRLAFLSDLIMMVFCLLTAWTLYNLFKNINKKQSILFFIFISVSTAVYSMNMINHIAILELNGLNEQKQLIQLFTNLHYYGYLIAQIYFGLWLLPLGIIILESKIMPKYFGIMLIAAVFGHMIEVIVTFLFPGNDFNNFIINFGLIIAMLGEFSFCFWLLFKGIKIENK